MTKPIEHAFERQQNLIAEVLLHLLHGIITLVVVSVLSDAKAAAQQLGQTASTLGLAFLAA